MIIKEKNILRLFVYIPKVPGKCNAVDLCKGNKGKLRELELNSPLGLVKPLLSYQGISLWTIPKIKSFVPKISTYSEDWGAHDAVEYFGGCVVSNHTAPTEGFSFIKLNIIYQVRLYSILKFDLRIDA